MSSTGHRSQGRAMLNFTDLRREINTGVGETTGPYCCYVGNASSQFPPPRKYTYRGCTGWKFPKVMCQKSIEGFGDKCEHNPVALGNHAHMYRLDLLLFDANGSTPPIVAIIFAEAHKLLEMPAEDFVECDERRQAELLLDVTFKAPMCNLWMKSQGPDHKPIVNRLEKIVSIDSPEREVYRTPTADLSRFSSPRSSMSSSNRARGGVASSPMYSGRRHVVLDEDEAEKVQRSLAEAMTLFSIRAQDSKSPTGSFS